MRFERRGPVAGVAERARLAAGLRGLGVAERGLGGVSTRMRDASEALTISVIVGAAFM